MSKLKLNHFIWSVALVVLLKGHVLVEGQQIYVDNKQLNCAVDLNYTDGFACNGVAKSCSSYLTFRSNPPYNTPSSIGLLMGSSPQDIAEANSLNNFETIPTDTQILIPVNCSCSSQYYQYNATYKLQLESETYFIVANDTYQGLSTCQALIAQNPYDTRNLTVGLNLTVPLRCACPTSNQTAAGFNYLLTYMITWGDDISTIAALFGADEQSVLDANQLSESDIIYPFTPILIPLKTRPSKIQKQLSPPPPASPPQTTVIVSSGNSKSSNKWVVYVAVGVPIGAAALILLSVLLFCFFRRRRRSPPSRKDNQLFSTSPTPPTLSTNTKQFSSDSWSVSTQGVRYAIESLTVYKFDEVEKATGFFGEANRIEGSVYRGTFKGDDGAVKVMKGDVSDEINLLKRINHTNIIRLSGYCLHAGNTYLVYEYASNGSLTDCLHSNKYKTSLLLTWKQRVQIAHDIADALNYLHNYTNPPYIHKNLKTSNILVDANFRAMISNFGLARTVEMDNQEEEGGGFQLTRHVVGTQGYMAPEYIENGVLTPKLDVFAFGVVLLELLSGREATGKDEELLSASVRGVLEGDNVRHKLKAFVDPSLQHHYPLDLAFSMAQLAKNCVAHDLNSRPAIAEVFMTLSKILSSSLDWDPSDELERSTSLTPSIAR